MKYKLVLLTPIILQFIFFMLFITNVLGGLSPNYSIIISLTIGISSLLISILGLWKKVYPKALGVTLFISLLIIIWSIFVFLLPEAGIAPLIK